jgi:myosin heavy subunit
MVLAAVVAVGACEGSRAATMKQLAEMQAISAQKDSLLKEVTATSAFLANLSKQVSTVRNLKAGRPASNAGSDLEDNLTPAERRAQLIDQVQEVTQRVNMAENRLAASRRRVAELTGSDAEKSKRLAEFDSTITSFKQLMDNQKTQIAALNEQVDELTNENTRLKADNVQLVSQTASLTTERDSLTRQENTVYYVVAPQKTLEQQHVVERVGGFLGFGKTPVAMRDLDKNQFVPIDMTQTLEIPLPDSTRQYRIITRQDVAALETPPDGHGRIKGTLRIRDPKAFWANSRFLIVIEQ